GRCRVLVGGCSWSLPPSLPAGGSFNIRVLRWIECYTVVTLLPVFTSGADLAAVLTIGNHCTHLWLPSFNISLLCQQRFNLHFRLTLIILDHCSVEFRVTH